MSNDNDPPTPLPPLSAGQTIADSVATPSDHTYPPIPSYTTLYPTIQVSAPNESVVIPSTEIQPQGEVNLGHGEVADDLQQYAIAHDHIDAGVAPRLPEAFPVDQLSLRSSQGPPESLPAYGANEPPRYTPRIENHVDEPETLAMHFFKFGFFFPAFWVFGALMLITPLRSPNPLSPVAQLSVWPPNSDFVAWCNEHVRTEEDKEAFLARMQEVEMKWAKRCLLALGMLLCFVIAIGVTIFGVLKVKNL